MTESANHPEPHDDPRLSRLLREAGDGQLPGVEQSLARARRALLGQLAAGEPAGRSSGFLARHQIALASLAASLALLAALLVALNSGSRLSAMERMAGELEKITSYSYRSTGSNHGIDDKTKRPTTYKDDSIDIWSAPDAFYQEMKIVKIVEDVGGGNSVEELLERFDELNRAGGAGAFIDHQYKTYCRTLSQPIGSKMYPWDILRMIREQSYDVLADLGAKRMGETMAHGYRLKLKNPHDAEITMIDEPIDLWVDSETDLPVEFTWSCESEGWKQTDRTFDFRWNLPVDPKRFEPARPQGYADITPPTETKDLDQIATALRIYSQISGGKYPSLKKFTASAARDEMAKLADAADSDAALAERKKQLDEAAPGLNWIGSVVRNRYRSGYRGWQVGPADKDQVLLWWMTADGYHFRVFYGDLRTEVLDKKAWSQLVPEAMTIDYEKLE